MKKHCDNWNFLSLFNSKSKAHFCCSNAKRTKPQWNIESFVISKLPGGVLILLPLNIAFISKTLDLKLERKLRHLPGFITGSNHTTGHFLQNLTELPPALAGGSKGATKIWALAQVFLHHFWAKAQISDCFSAPQAKACGNSAAPLKNVQ